MAHDHDHHSEGNLKVAFMLNAAFTVFEVAGGIWTNSIAILTDALHDAGDSLSLGLAWYFERISHRGSTARHSYGFRRYRLLGGLITGLSLIFGMAFILWHAIGRLLSPESVKAPGMILLAVVGIAFNGAALLRVKTGASLTERLVSWHLIEDILGWVAVLVGAAIMCVWNLPALDPILSIMISAFVLWNVGRNLKQVVGVFLQTTPDSFDPTKFESAVAGIAGVVSSHHTHTWSLDGESHILTMHLVMAPDTDREGILAAKQLVRELLDPAGFKHVTIDVELEGEKCLSDSHPTVPEP
jgi:cobalt-zinc-cadmium efflux system protein